MRLRTLAATTFVLATSFSGHAMAQQPTNMHYYLGMFKYASNAVKAMMENPQDRSEAARKVIEGLGGEMDAIFFYATSGDWDGIVLVEFPDDTAAEALYMTVQARTLSIRDASHMIRPRRSSEDALPGLGVPPHDRQLLARCRVVSRPEVGNRPWRCRTTAQPPPKRW